MGPTDHEVWLHCAYSTTPVLAAFAHQTVSGPALPSARLSRIQTPYGDKIALFTYFSVAKRIEILPGADELGCCIEITMAATDDDVSEGT